MTKTSKNNEKGHRPHAVIKCHIPFYSSVFFDPNGQQETEEGEVQMHSSDKMVKIPIKIAANGNESRSNVTTFEIKGITHFDNNIENVLNAFMNLNERVIKPKNMQDKNEEFKMILELLQLLCTTGPATQTLQEALKLARTRVVHQLLALNHASASGQEGHLIDNEQAFFQFLEQDFQDLDPEVYPDKVKYRTYLFGEYNRHFFNYLHSIIFGPDAYRAFKQQKAYLMNQIIKPFGVSVEAAFRRIEIISNLMEYFPPPSSKGKHATQAQWDAFGPIKKLSNDDKREIKYNLLPPFFQERIDDLEGDWTEWDDTKFLAQVQKCEQADRREQKRRASDKQKEKSSNKRKKDDDDNSTSNLSRSQKDRNNKFKKKRDDADTSTAGQARFCELCKLAGAPEHVYKTHYTSQCRKKERYAQSLSGGTGSRRSTVKEFKSMEKRLLKELKMVQKKKKKLSRKKGSDSDESDSDDSMSS